MPVAFVALVVLAQAILPPELPWNGKSRELFKDARHAWATPFEASGLRETPRYDATMACLRRLAAASSELRVSSLGRSPEGREILMLIASRERAFTPQALKAAGKPTLFAQAAIHAGEIDGKDAGLMLLRDIAITKEKAELLDAANLLFVPIFNVDGHERFSATTRVNQRGPVEAGSRTTARNLNINRDYTKLDAPETRAMVKALDAWDPELYVDVHVTDGADYVYDVTFGPNGLGGPSPEIQKWLAGVLGPALERDLSSMGHWPGPLIQLTDDKDPTRGFAEWTAGPRYSTGYADARHMPALLVENHSLKPYPQRVAGAYVLIESAMRLLGKEKATLRKAIAADRARRTEHLALDWAAAEPLGEVSFEAVDWRLVDSAVSGGKKIEWLGRPRTIRVPKLGMKATASATRPKAYWIPPSWPEVIERLRIHGVRMQETRQATDVAVEMLRAHDPKVGEIFEGHVPVTATLSLERRTESYPAGSVRVPTDQPLGDLAMMLLEPASPDSFFQWGFFLETLQRTEYAEEYVMAPMAERMLAEDEALRAEFEQKLAADTEFRGNAKARLDWFYRRTPFYDERYGLYPVGRER